MSAKKLTSPNSVKGQQTFRQHDIKIIPKFDCFTSINTKINKSINYKHQNTQAIDQNFVHRTPLKEQEISKTKAQREKIINQLLQENLRLKEQNNQKNKLIEMLIEERSDIKRVTSLHFPAERELLQSSKTHSRVSSPNQMEFTFYKSPYKGLPKEFQITPSRKLFF